MHGAYGAASVSHMLMHARIDSALYNSMSSVRICMSLNVSCAGGLGSVAEV